jgi:hypothetical protein
MRQETASPNSIDRENFEEKLRERQDAAKVELYRQYQSEHHAAVFLSRREAEKETVIQEGGY